jgi:hypothetical protein
MEPTPTDDQPQPRGAQLRRIADPRSWTPQSKAVATVTLLAVVAGLLASIL